VVGPVSIYFLGARRISVLSLRLPLIVGRGVDFMFRARRAVCVRWGSIFFCLVTVSI